MAQTNLDAKFYICTTPQPDDLTQSEFEALSFVEVGNIGTMGETGVNENILSYDTYDTDVTQKAKGIANAGDPTLEVARVYNDAGQIAMRAAALTNFQYAFKREDADAPDASTTNTIIYMRGVVTGPVRPNGGPEDFIIESFTLGLNQREILVDPTAIP